MAVSSLRPVCEVAGDTAHEEQDPAAGQQQHGLVRVTADAVAGLRRHVAGAQAHPGVFVSGPLPVRTYLRRSPGGKGPMTKRLFGPPPPSEDPYAKLTSPRGIPVDQLVSVLQKEIRRGNVGNAVLAAYEMLSTSADVAEHLWGG